MKIIMMKQQLLKYRRRQNPESLYQLQRRRRPTLVNLKECPRMELPKTGATCHHNLRRNRSRLAECNICIGTSTTIYGYLTQSVKASSHNTWSTNSSNFHTYKIPFKSYPQIAYPQSYDNMELEISMMIRNYDHKSLSFRMLTHPTWKINK